MNVHSKKNELLDWLQDDTTAANMNFYCYV